MAKEYIEREAAIGEIGEWYEMYPDSDAAREALSLAKRAIRKLPAADVRPVEWIPVTERLPEMLDGENLSKEVYVTDGAEIAKACIMRDYDGVTGWTYTGIGEITHWCEQIPLPQPPKEEMK